MIKKNFSLVLKFLEIRPYSDRAIPNEVKPK